MIEKDKCQVKTVQKTLLFETDIFVALILQIVFYRMLTLFVKLKQQSSPLEHSPELPKSQRIARNTVFYQQQ
jgi:hypothetical protein